MKIEIHNETIKWIEDHYDTKSKEDIEVMINGILEDKQYAKEYHS